MSNEPPIPKAGVPRLRRTPLTRRTVLRGVGAAMALPMFDAFAPRRASADTPAPTRLAFVFAPNGVVPSAWMLKNSELHKNSGDLAKTKLTPSLEPIAPVAAHLNVISGLNQNMARALGDGPGDHARSAAVFLTGAHPVKTSGKDIRLGVSVDQVAARVLAAHTTFPSLELGLERSRTSGRCDSGYSCAYTSNVSWRGPSTPNPKEVNPRRVFERLFLRGRPGESDAERQDRVSEERSLLDLVREQSRRLKQRLGLRDRAKLDQYLTSVREIERRIESAEREVQSLRTKLGGAQAPVGIPSDIRAHSRLMSDMTVLAFRTDVTRVVTLMLGNGGSNRSYPFLDVPEGHHGLSHHGKDKAKMAKIQRIDRWFVEEFAYLVNELQSTQEGEHTLLDQSLVLYGSGIRDGNRHNHGDLPILLAGRGGGAVRTGRHIQVAPDRPLNDLFLTMLDTVGAGIPRLGDSTGMLPGLG